MICKGWNNVSALAACVALSCTTSSIDHWTKPCWLIVSSNIFQHAKNKLPPSGTPAVQRNERMEWIINKDRRLVRAPLRMSVGLEVISSSLKPVSTICKAIHPEILKENLANSQRSKQICDQRCFLFLALSCTWSSWKPAVSSRASSKLAWHWDAWIVWVVHDTKAHGGRHCKICTCLPSPLLYQLLDVTGSDHIDLSCFSRHWLASLRTAWLLTSLACFSIPWPMGDRTPVPCRGRHSSADVLSWIHFSIHHRLSCAIHGWLGPASSTQTTSSTYIYIIIVQPCKLQHVATHPLQAFTCCLATSHFSHSHDSYHVSIMYPRRDPATQMSSEETGPSLLQIQILIRLTISSHHWICEQLQGHRTAKVWWRAVSLALSQNPSRQSHTSPEKDRYQEPAAPEGHITGDGA